MSKFQNGDSSDSDSYEDYEEIDDVEEESSSSSNSSKNSSGSSSPSQSGSKSSSYSGISESSLSLEASKSPDLAISGKVGARMTGKKDSGRDGLGTVKEPISLVVAKESQKLLYFVSKGNFEMMEECLGRVANANVVHVKTGRSALMIAVTFRGSNSKSNNNNNNNNNNANDDKTALKLTELLLKHQAQPNTVNFHGETCLHLCARNNRADCADLVIKAGGNISQRDYKGRNAMELAVKYLSLDVIVTLLMYRAKSFDPVRLLSQAQESMAKWTENEETKKKIQQILLLHNRVQNLNTNVDNENDDDDDDEDDEDRKGIPTTTATKLIPLDQILTEIKANTAIEVNLNFCEDNVGDEGLRAISLVMKHNESVQKMLLRNCNLSDVGISYLTESLQSNKSTILQRLGFGSNEKIGNRGCEMISSRILSSSSSSLSSSSSISMNLKELWLDRCGISSIGAKSLGKALKDNHNLQKIVLRRNSFGDKGVIDFFCLLYPGNMKLREIYIGNNNVTNEGFKVILDTIALHQPNLHRLELTDNEITDDGMKFAINLAASGKLVSIGEIMLDNNSIRSEYLQNFVSAMNSAKAHYKKTLGNNNSSSSLSLKKKNLNVITVNSSSLISRFKASLPRKVTVFRNAITSFNSTGNEVLVPTTWDTLMMTIEIKLCMTTRARHLFLFDGEEVTNMDQIINGMNLVVTSGEQLCQFNNNSMSINNNNNNSNFNSSNNSIRRSSSSSSSSSSTANSTTAASNATVPKPFAVANKVRSKKIVLAIKNGDNISMTMNNNQAAKIVVPRTWDSFVDEIRRKLGFANNVQRLFDSNGAILSNLDEIQDNMVVIASTTTSEPFLQGDENRKILHWTSLMKGSAPKCSKDTEKRAPIIFVHANGKPLSEGGGVNSILLPNRSFDNHDCNSNGNLTDSVDSMSDVIHVNYSIGGMTPLKEERAWNLLLNACQQRLGITSSARRLFQTNGKEILDINEIMDGMHVVVSSGESFKKIPKEGYSARDQLQETREKFGVYYKYNPSCAQNMEKRRNQIYIVPNGFHCDTNKAVLVNTCKTFEQTLDECFSRLSLFGFQLQFAIRRIFDSETGEEIKSLSSLKDEALYVVTQGEEFRRPKGWRVNGGNNNNNNSNNNSNYGKKEIVNNNGWMSNVTQTKSSSPEIDVTLYRISAATATTTTTTNDNFGKKCKISIASTTTMKEFKEKCATFLELQSQANDNHDDGDDDDDDDDVNNINEIIIYSNTGKVINTISELSNNIELFVSIGEPFSIPLHLRLIADPQTMQAITQREKHFHMQNKGESHKCSNCGIVLPFTMGELFVNPEALKQSQFEYLCRSCLQAGVNLPHSYVHIK